MPWESRRKQFLGSDSHTPATGTMGMLAIGGDGLGTFLSVQRDIRERPSIALSEMLELHCAGFVDLRGNGRESIRRT